MASEVWNDSAGLLEQASAAQRSGERELAYEFYARASELAPDTAQAWRGRAATTPLEDDALVSCAYAVALCPADHSLADELDQRLRIRCAEATRNVASSLVAVGQKLAEVGLARQAHQLFRRATELDDTLEEGFLWSAATTEDLGEASVALKRALALSPTDARARAGFSKVMLQLDGAAWTPAPTAPAITQGEQVGPLADSIPELVRSGENALVAGDKGLAYKAFVRATELGPREEAAWLGRARASNDIDETLTCLEQALAINPDNMQAREARTFYRVRKLREGVRKRQEPVEEPKSMPSFAGGGGFTEQPTAEVRKRRMLLLAMMLVVLLVLILAFLIQFRLIGG